jgi:hypothetical protein
MHTIATDKKRPDIHATQDGKLSQVTAGNSRGHPITPPNIYFDLKYE